MLGWERQEGETLVDQRGSRQSDILTLDRDRSTEQEYGGGEKRFRGKASEA